MNIKEEMETLRRDFMIAKPDISWLTFAANLGYNDGSFKVEFTVHCTVRLAFEEDLDDGDGTIQIGFREGEMASVNHVPDLGNALEEAYRRARFNAFTNGKKVNVETL